MVAFQERQRDVVQTVSFELGRTLCQGRGSRFPLWGGRRWTALFKFTFFSVCFDGTHSDLHFLERFSAEAGFWWHFRGSSPAPCPLRKPAVLTQLPGSRRASLSSAASNHRAQAWRCPWFRRWAERGFTAGRKETEAPQRCHPCQKREQRDETQASGREPGSRSGAVREAWENTLLVLRSFQLRSECPERGWKVAKTTAF